MLRRLQRTVLAEPGRPALADEHHPIRQVTRQVAFEPGSWTAERAARVAALFDDLAPVWNDRPGVRQEAVVDALDRGGPFPDGLCLEVGSGTGMATPLLADRFSPVVAVDLSAAMLALAPQPWPRVRGDAASLPVAGGAAAVLVVVNMFLFPAEMDRVLAPAGVLVWVNTLGEVTPIHLAAGDVAAALPGEWDAVASDAGWGTWAALRRAPGGRPGAAPPGQAATRSGSTLSTNSSNRPRPSDGQLHTR